MFAGMGEVEELYHLVFRYKKATILVEAYCSFSMRMMVPEALLVVESELAVHY